MAKALIDRRLLGVWKSDRRETFRLYRPNPKGKPAAIRRFKALVGKLIVRWGTQYVSTDLEGFKSRDPYKVIAKDENSVIVRTKANLFGDELRHIHFEGEDQYWLWVAGNLREYFRRVR